MGNLWRVALWAAGLYLLVAGLASFIWPEGVGALLGIERVASTTSMRMIAGNSAIVGALLSLIAARGRGEGAFVSLAALLCAGAAAVLFHSAQTVIGSPLEQVAGERVEGALYAAAALLLVIARLAGTSALGPLFGSTAPAVAGPSWLVILAQVLIALLGLALLASGLRGLLSPAENAVSGGIPYGMLWSVTPARIVGWGFAVFGSGMLYAALKPRAGRMIVAGLGLVLVKNVFVMLYGAATVAMPVPVYEASTKGGIAFAVMAVIAGLLWLVVRRAKRSG